MRLRSQYIVSVVIFGILLAIISTSAVFTSQQAAQINNQEQTAGNIQTGASDLSYLSNDYFLFQQDVQLTQWQSKFSTLMDNLSKLNPNSPDQQRLINNVTTDLQSLVTVFNSSVAFLENAPRNESVRILPEFQTAWSQLAAQNQKLASDASVLSKSFSNQADQLKNTSSILILALIGAFGAYFVTVYFMVYRRTLRSITKLHEGTRIIGSGNLDYSIVSKSNDEIGELSQAFNQMTANLKTVTASKTDLEQEIAGRKQAEISLRESEQRWATTLGSIGDAVIATDVSGAVMFMNGVAEELTGWILSEALSNPVKKVFNIISEQTRLEVEDPVTKVFEEGMIVGLANHTVLIRKDGTEVAIDDSGAPIRDPDGKVTGVVLVFRDITQRRKAEQEIAQSKQRLEAHMNNSPEGVIEFDPQFRVLRWSEEAQRMFGWSAEEIMGKSISQLPWVYKDDVKLVEQVSAEMISGKRPRNVSSSRNYRKDGSVIDCEWYNSAIYDANGKLASILSLVLDVTARKQMREKLEDYAKNLEKLVEERTMQLKASERFVAIGQTAGMVGHDIRNPLQAITGDVYLAKSDVASLPESEEKASLQESLEAVEKNVEYINKIVADLQDFARPLKPVAKETDLKEVIENLLSRNGAPKNIKVSSRVENDAKKIVTDSVLLKRILGNLVTNAVQAMPEGGKLSVRAYRDARDYVITVKDTGVGIPEEARGKLFTPLFTTKSKGQGFGLAVVKRITEALGGTVTFKSEEGKGTTFAVRLSPTKK